MSRPIISSNFCKRFSGHGACMIYARQQWSILLNFSSLKFRKNCPICTKVWYLANKISGNADCTPLRVHIIETMVTPQREWYCWNEYKLKFMMNCPICFWGNRLIKYYFIHYICSETFWYNTKQFQVQIERARDYRYSSCLRIELEKGMSW